MAFLRLIRNLTGLARAWHDPGTCQPRYSPLLATLFLFGCYGAVPPNPCPDENLDFGEVKVEYRVERNLSQRVLHAWYETLDSNSNWVKHGPEVLYYPAGHLKAKYLWQFGKKEGLFEFYHPNAALSAQGNYSRDKFDGEVKSWDEKGHLTQIKSWKDGQLEGWQEKRNSQGEVLERYYFFKGQKLDSAP